MLVDGLERFGAALRLGDLARHAAVEQQLAHALANHGVIFGDQNAQAHDRRAHDCSACRSARGACASIASHAKRARTSVPRDAWPLPLSSPRDPVRRALTRNVPSNAAQRACMPLRPKCPRRLRGMASQPDAVVADEQREVLAAGFDPHVGRFGARVLRNIVQRFLGDAEHGQRGVGGQAREAHVGGADETRAQLRAAREVAGPVRERAHNARFERRRMQFRHGLAARGARGVERTVGDGERGGALRRRIGGQPGFDAGERKAHGGQLGADAVVQFARHMAAGGFLRLNQFGRQFADPGAQPRKLALSGATPTARQRPRRSRHAQATKQAGR